MIDRQRETTLFSEPDIARRVGEIARDIAARPERPDIAVPILSGAYVFAADLMRALSGHGMDLETEFMWLRAYGGRQNPGEVRVLLGPSEIVRERNVLLIDGVLDSGATARKARALLLDAGAASVIFAVAVRKQHANGIAPADHVCFDAGPEFLYGYGMDRAGLRRGYPDIRALAHD